MDENNSYNSTMTDFQVVEDGHDGQTEEQKREAYAADTSAQGDNGGESGTAKSAAEDKPEKGEEGAAQRDHDDSRYQAARRSGEDAGYQRAYREMNQRIASAGMRNPESGEIIGDIDGLESFSKSVRKQRIAERAKREGRSEADVEEDEANREFLRQSRREAEEKKKADAEAEKQKQWIAKDVRDFTKRFPDVDLGKLDNDRAFRRFCGTRYGKEPLGDLYEDYLAITGDAGRAARASKESKDSRSTSGSRSGGGSTLTAEEKSRLEEWNRAYPNMKMTEAEFASRG